MADSPSRAALQRIVNAHHIPSGQLPPTLQRLTAKDVVISPNQNDEERAEAVIAQHKSLTRKPSVLRTKRRVQSFKFKTVTEILPAAVKTEPAAVIYLLLEKGGDASSIKEEADQASELAKRKRLLLDAIEGGQSDTIRFLASKASKDRLNEALTTVLARRQFDTARILLQFGADPNHCSTQFIEVASTGDADVMRCLLSAPTSFSNDNLAKALVAAVRNNSVFDVVMIAETKELTQPELEAVSLAVTQGKFSMLLAILLHSPRLSADFLAKQVLSAYQSSNGNRRAMIEALFAAGAGATSNDACAAFALAVEHTDPLTAVFVDNHVDVNWGAGKAVRRAVRAGNSDLVKTVMSSSALTSSNACRAMKEIPRRMDLAHRIAILALLLDAGAHGNAVDDQLVIAVQDKHEAAVNLLRSRGAALDGNDGDALFQAIHNEDLATLRLLLQGTINTAALERAFPHLRHKTHAFDMMKLMLSAGASGDAIHAALREAVADHQPRLIDILLNARANPTYSNSSSLRRAIADADAPLLRKLLEAPAGVSCACASPLVPLIQKMPKTDARLQMMRLVMHKCTGDESIALALLQELSSGVACHRMVEILVAEGNADINHNDGRAVQLGTADLAILRIIVASSLPKPDSIQRALDVMLLSDLTDDEKAARAAVLLRSKKLPKAARHGILTYINHCRTSLSGDWPLATFKILLDAKPDLNANAGEIALGSVCSGGLGLIKLMAPSLTQSVVNTALLKSQATSAIAAAFTELLLRYAPSQLGISSALITACQNKLIASADLLRHGASLDHHNYAAIRAAVSNIKLLKLLLASKPSSLSLAAAFDQAIALESAAERFEAVEAILKTGLRGKPLDEYLIVLVQQATPGLMFVQLLLDHAADVNAKASQSLRSAAVSRHLEILQLLWRYNQSERAASCAFDDCVRAGLIQLHDKEIIEFLFDNGAKGQLLDQALDLAVERAVTSNDTSMVRLLLKHGANSNSSNGRSLCHATKLGHVELVKLLATYNAVVEVRVKGMLALVTSDLTKVSTADFCSTARILSNSMPRDEGRFVKSVLASMDDSPVRKLLERRPKGVVELKQILEVGLRASGADILHWSMTASPRIKTECVQTLIEHGANVKYVHETNTMIMIAVQTGRGQLIKQLIERGADPSAKDAQGRSPLLLSVEKQSNVADLVDAAVVNDGSLHQAVHLLQPFAVEQLLERGHSPMLPSPFRGHARRTPLAELMATSIDPTKYHLVTQVIGLLVTHGADVTKRVAGKPLICLALDNSSHAAAALLQVLHSQIDEDFNLFKNDAYCYSPTSYVLKGLCGGSRNEISDKLDILRQYGAERVVFYALSGPQPDDADGMPPEMKIAEDERRAKLRKQAEEEAEHQTRIRRIDEIAARTEQAALNAHQADLRRRAMEEQETQRQIRSRHDLQLQLDRDRQSAETQAEMVRQDARRRERLQIEAHQKSLDSMETTKRRQMYQLEQENQRTLLLQQGQAEIARAAIQKQLAIDVAKQDGVRHERRMKELQMETAKQIGWTNGGTGYGGQRVIEY
jgi:ankyrin repeat protein